MTSQSDQLDCWKCGAVIEDTPLPLARTSACRSCNAELHVCKMCEFFDTRVANQCREPIAEVVNDKTRANFCDYFQAKPHAFVAQDTNESARAQLDALFGDAPKESGESDQEQTAEQIAKQKLEDLFKK